jgi:hypothetical protein
VKYLWNRYLVKMRDGRATLEEQLKMAISFDMTIRSHSNIYKSFGRSFPWSTNGIATW